MAHEEILVADHPRWLLLVDHSMAAKRMRSPCPKSPNMTAKQEQEEENARPTPLLTSCSGTLIYGNDFVGPQASVIKVFLAWPSGQQSLVSGRYTALSFLMIIIHAAKLRAADLSELMLRPLGRESSLGIWSSL